MPYDEAFAMTMQAIFAERAFTPLEEIANPVVLIDDGKIAAIGPRSSLAVPSSASRWEAQGLTLVPGFIDMHIHGGAGHDVMEGTAEALAAITELVARHGTTSFVATTVTASEDGTNRALTGIASWMRSTELGLPHDVPRAEILGVHLEGPFISTARRGVHPPEWIVPPSVKTFKKFMAAAGSHAIRILTLAPELPGALELIAAAISNGVLVSMGHTDATYDEAMRAIEHGARHAAHVFNAMRPFAHRDSGVIGAVLASPDVTAELIADGIHVDAGAVRTLLAAKGARAVVLVSDGTSATGMPDGTYRLGTFDVSVSGGVCRNAEGKLAGSTLTLDRALRNMLGLGVPMRDALAMLTENPARALGLEGKKGSLVPGADADLVLLNAQHQFAGVMTRGSRWPADGLISS